MSEPWEDFQQAEEGPWSEPWEQYTPPDTSKSTLGAFGKTLLSVPENLLASGITAVQGVEGASVTDRGIGDKIVNWVDERNKALAEEYRGTGDFIPGLISKEDVAQLGANLAFSGVSMAASVAGGILGSPGGLPGAIVGGMAGGGLAAHRMQSYSAMNDWLNRKNEESLKLFGRPISPDEEAAFKERFEKLATESGLWEAGPEAVGNVLELALMGGKRLLPGGRLVPDAVTKTLARKILGGVGRIAGILATEEATETVTQMGQHNIEVEAGMSDEPMRQWNNPEDWLKSAMEVLPQVIMLTGVMGAGGAAYRKFSISTDPTTLEIDKQMEGLPEEKKAVTPVFDFEGGIGGLGPEGRGQGGEGFGPAGAGIGPIDLTGIGQTEGAGTGAEAIGGFGIGEAPQEAPARKISDAAQGIWDRLSNNQLPESGDPRLDNILLDARNKTDLRHPWDIQNILDDYEAGMYPEEKVAEPPAEPVVPTEEVKPPEEAAEVKPPEEAPPLPEAEIEAPPVSATPPPVNGKRNWYEFADPNFPADQRTDEEYERVADNTGPTPEEQAAYDKWRSEKGAAVAAIQKEQDIAEAKGAEILARAQRKWKENYPNISLPDVANIIAEIGGNRDRQLKASEFLSEFTQRIGIPNQYEFLGKILDRMGVQIHLVSHPSADPSSARPGARPKRDAADTGGYTLTDAAFIIPVDRSNRGRIHIAHKATAKSMDYGPGYGPAHAIESFVHEALHAIVQNSPNWERSKAKLHTFRESLLKHQASAPESVRLYLRHSDKYEVDELISEALSDAKFAQWLDSIPAEGVKNQSKTLWGQLKDIIFRALETFGVGKSKLDELNDVLDEVLGMPADETVAEKKPELPLEEKPEPPEKAPEPTTPRTPEELSNVIHPEYGTLNKPNTVALAELFKTRLTASDVKFDKDMLKTIVANAFDTTPKELSVLERSGRYNHKAIEEAFEYAVILRAREIINEGGGLDQITALYNRQANLASRTSESTIMQQYSTPAPIAWLMNKFLDMTGLNSRVSVYEPTAGNGMLLIGANERSTRIFANELDKGARLANLRDFIKEGKVTNGDALSLVTHPGPKSVDRVIMNPPFGTAKNPRAFDGYQLSKLEHQIVATALIAMKNNGKAAFIIGGHNVKSSGQMTMPDKIFMNWLYNNFNVTHNIDVNGDLYTRQGTKFPIRLITIEGRKEVPSEGLPEYTNIEPAETFQDISSILERGKPDEERGPAAQAGGKEGVRGAELPNGVPETGVLGGRPAGGENLPGGELGNAETGEPGRGTPGRPEPGGERGGEIQQTGGTGVRGGERITDAGVVPAGTEGGETGRPVEKGPQSSLEDALDELDALFAPYESADEEAKYQEAKPVFTNIATEVINDDAAATSVDVIQKMKGKLAAKWDAAKKYVFRFMREEFDALAQIIKDSSFFQTDYKPRSQGPDGHTRVPRNQEQSIQKALDEIEEEHGNIDDWVMKELQYPNREALYKAFAAEQIDALAMSIQNITNNSGMILGDQTGVGKGRVVAGIIRWSNKKLNKIPIFVTDKPNLFSDMYRDLVAIDHPIRPFVMNSAKANILNQDTGDVIINQAKDGKGAEAYAGGSMDWGKVTSNPEAYFKRNNMSAVFTTYSQHMDASFKKQDAILDAMGRNNIFILDESHNAAGPSTGEDSNTKRKFAHFLNMADGVLYSSATFAKTPENMGIYYRTGLGDTGMRMWELAAAIKAGGNPLQEYISNALARMGQYLRRELDFTGVDFTSSDTMANLSKTDPDYDNKLARLKEQYERDKNASDKSNVVVRNNVEFSNAIKRERPGLEALLRDKYGVMLGGSGDQRMSATTTSFASVVHNFNSQLLMGIKVQRTIDEAKQALAEGRKVVINLTNTMGSFIEDMVQKGHATVGEQIDFTFKGVLQRAIDNTKRINITDAQGNDLDPIFLTPEDMQSYMPASYSAYLRVTQSLKNYDVSDLHSSPIDFMLHELQKISGKPVMELTNRDYTIDYGDKSGAPVLKKRTGEVKDRQRAIRMFNTGTSDVIIINRAGSVGISLHASETFKDKKPRRMLLLQPDTDINIFMQALGRIFRKGQVALPDYRYITSDLPTEIRPNVVLTRKMKSLKANTTSKQGGAEARADIPDMMNHHGDRVTREYLDRNREMAMRLGFFPIPDNLTYVKASGRASILPVELQKEFFADIENDYNSRMDELTMRGENDLISKNYDYKAISFAKNVIYAGPDPKNPFTGSTYVEVMRVRQLKQPHRMAKLQGMIKEVLSVKKSPGGETAFQVTGEQFSTELYLKVEQAAQAFWTEWNAKLAEKYPGDTEAQERARSDKNRQLQNELSEYKRLLNPRNPSQQLRIGDTYEVPLGVGSQENLTGVLTNITWAPGQGNPAQLSKLKLVFSVSDPIQTMVYNGSQGWFKDEVELKNRGIPTDWDMIIPEGRQEEKVIVTGNMVKAFNILLSISPKIHFEMVNFTREDKSKEFGLVIARADEERIRGITEGSLGREVNWKVAHDYLADPRVETERITASKNGEVDIQSIITVRKPEDGGTTREYTVRVPASKEKGAKYYQDEKLRSFVRDNNFRRHGQRFVANLDADKLQGFMEELYKKFSMNFVLPQEQVSMMPFEQPPIEGKGEEQMFMPFVPAIPWVNDLTDRFLNKPQDMPAEDLANLKTFLGSQNDFQFKDEYFGLPWWNAKKYPAWRKAFEIFGIQRPENRGAHMHSFAQLAEPFFKLDETMKKAGKTAAERQDAKARINRVIITGDALLGPQLKALRQQARIMKDGPEKDRINERIRQIETENRYSDEQLLAGIRDDQGQKVKLSQEEIEVYKSVRQSLDFMFDTYVDHLQTQAFRRYKNQKWYAILAQAAGMDLNKTTTLRIVGAGLNQTSLLRAIKIQPDINKIFDRVEKGILQTPEGEKIAAGNLYDKIAEKMSEQIQSLEKALSELTGETDPKKLTDMTRAILSAYMYTRPQLKLIKALRNTYKKQVAFFPRVREQGKYKVRLIEQIKDKEGMVVKERLRHTEMFDNEAAGRKIYDGMLKRWGKDGVFPENFKVSFESAAKTPEFAFQGVNDIHMQKVYDDAIENMRLHGQTVVNKKGEKVDIAEQLRQAGYMAIAKQFQSRGFGRHAIHRQWNVIKGYEEENLQRVLFNYMSGMSGIMTKQVAASDFLEMMKDDDVRKSPQLFKSLVKYGRDQLRNESKADKFSSKVRSFMFTWYLGGVLRPAVLQFTQNFVTGIPKHAQYLRENNLGGAGKADKDYTKAMKDVAFKNYTELEKRMQAQLFTEGVTVDQYIREIFGSLGNRFSQETMRVLHFLAYPFSRMEQFNRQSAALTRFRPAYELALKEGLPEEEAYDKAFDSARDYVYDTHYAYGKANLPQIAQGEGVGVAVKTLYTFKSFTHNYCLAMYNDMSKGDWKTWMHSLAYLALFGGLMGLPFFKDLFEFIEKHFGYNFTGSIRKTLNSAGGKTLETFGMNGLPAMLGINMSGALAIGVPFMGTTPQDTVYGVYGGQYQKMKRAGEAATRGDWYRTAANIVPEFMRGPVVAAEESQIGKELFGTPGVATTTRGRPVYDEKGKPLSMSAGQAVAKIFGFQPTEYARQKEKDQTVRRQETWAAEAKADAAEAYRIARINKRPDALKDMMKAVKEINQGIRDRGIQGIVPFTSVAKILESSRQSKTKQQLRQQRYKQGL